HDSASRTLTTNQPSPAGARPEPESSSGASGTAASLALEDGAVLEAQLALAVVLDGDGPAHDDVRAEQHVALDRQALALHERRRPGREACLEVGEQLVVVVVEVDDG